MANSPYGIVIFILSSLPGHPILILTSLHVGVLASGQDSSSNTPSEETEVASRRFHARKQFETR
jgi:hypothetical protein